MSAHHIVTEPGARVSAWRDLRQPVLFFRPSGLTVQPSYSAPVESDPVGKVLRRRNLLTIRLAAGEHVTLASHQVLPNFRSF